MKSFVAFAALVGAGAGRQGACRELIKRHSRFDPMAVAGQADRSRVRVDDRRQWYVP